MTEDKLSSKEAQKLIAEYGITHEKKSVYFYQGHRYDRLSDALRYARDGLDRLSTTVSTASD